MGNMIADTIPYEEKSAAERGLPPGSIWRVWFRDGSYREETDTSWAGISRLERVEYFGMKKSVRLCRFPVKRIVVSHDGMEAEIEVPEGTEAYQAIRSNIMATGDRSRGSIVGRCIGIVKDGEVLEELLINGQTHEVLGMKS